jgi:hypothetical protein
MTLGTKFLGAKNCSGNALVVCVLHLSLNFRSGILLLVYLLYFRKKIYKEEMKYIADLRFFMGFQKIAIQKTFRIHMMIR